MYVELIPGEHRFETRQCSKPIAFHLSNGTNQQEENHNRCSVEDYVRRRSCDRCRASGRIAIKEQWHEMFKKHDLKNNLDKTEVMWAGKQREEINIRLEGKYIKGALYRIQILCRRYTFWSYPVGLTIADPPG